MSEWKLHRVCGTRTTYARSLDGLDRIMVYVDLDLWDDETEPVSYDWQVADGSCGKVLDSGQVDGEAGLLAALTAADAAASRLFPVH